MTENTMFADLLAAQQEMPNLQKSAINPHFKNRYVPLEELVQAVLPILNKHNFVLLQMPAVTDGQPCLIYELRHASGEVVGATMLLQSPDDHAAALLDAAGKVGPDTAEKLIRQLHEATGPQQQGSAITYARRYSLMALLGLTADVDDDAEKTRTNGATPASRPSGGQGLAQRVPPSSSNHPTYDEHNLPVPTCPEHNVPCKLVPGGTSKASGKPYSSFFACPDKGCGQNGKSWTIFADRWATDWMMEHNTEKPQTQNEMAELPFE